MGRTTSLLVIVLLGSPGIVRADGPRAAPATWWRAWNWDPLLLLSLGLLAWWYGRGLARLWRKVGVGRKVHRWQAGCYFAGLGVLLVALVSPLDALGEELSSLHMVQHMLLMTVAAPLVVLSSSLLVLAWGLPEGGWAKAAFTFVFRLPQTSILWQPLFLGALFVVTLWAWHHPVLYQAALRDPMMHDAQHLSFFVVACLFWRAALDPMSVQRLGPIATTPYLFATSLHASALGVFLALSPQAWYDHYADRTSTWGFTPLEDQQLAGLLMWMPACLIFPAVAAVRFGTWLASVSGRTDNRHSRERCPNVAGG